MSLDRLIQVDDEVGRVANYTYDAVGNRLTSKDGNGNGTTSTYDADYRVTNVMDALGNKHEVHLRCRGQSAHYNRPHGQRHDQYL